MNIVDMHCDTALDLLRSRSGDHPISLRKNALMLDLEKMKKGGYLVQTFAAFVSLGRENTPNAPFVQGVRLLDELKQQMRENPDLIRPAYSYQDILENRKMNRMSGLLSVEEGQVCMGDPAILRTLYDLGVRMMTLTWNYDNDLASPNCCVSPNADMAAAPDPTQPDTVHGLKEKGFRIIEEMEKLGMIIDVSHLSDAGFWDILHHTTKPFIASHSNARALTPHPRNLTDEMIRALSERGGVSGLNYCTAFLETKMNPRVEGMGGTLAMMSEHVRYMIKVGGEDFVGLGSDFDGIDTPPEFRDASGLPMLAERLVKDGLTSAQVDKVMGGNVLRIFKEILH